MLSVFIGSARAFSIMESRAFISLTIRSVNKSAPPHSLTRQMWPQWLANLAAWELTVIFIDCFKSRVLSVAANRHEGSWSNVYPGSVSSVPCPVYHTQRTLSASCSVYHFPCLPSPVPPCLAHSHDKHFFWLCFSVSGVCVFWLFCCFHNFLIKICCSSCK